MAMALEIHREMEQSTATPMERELRRRLFWSCYLLDRFMACGSKRPSLISDKTVMLRLPAWLPSPSSGFVEGEFFQTNSNLQYFQGSGKKSQGSTGMLIDITRILGTTNRYLAAGGVRGDSHFPWHSLSNLSKIRQDLDTWASGTDDVFSSLETLFGQGDSTVLVLSKLIYHLIHCLIYRPFLPIDLAELAGSGQHESWQIEATNMCFLHANAIAELVELGKQTGAVEWPAFVGYCICTAGTVHIHGAHYSKQGAIGEMSVFGSSAHFLSREMQHLSDLRYAWASVQHQRETLQDIYNAHGELVQTLTGSPMRYAPSFHLEDFFERYANIGGASGQTFHFDAAHLSLSDAVVDFAADSSSGHDMHAPRASDDREREGPNKRRNTSTGSRAQIDVVKDAAAVEVAPPLVQLPPPSYPGRSISNQGGIMSQSSNALLTTPASMSRLHLQGHENPAQMTGMTQEAANNAAAAAAAAAGYGMPANQQAGQGVPNLSGGPFSPGYSNYAPAPGGANQDQNMMSQPSNFDPMFGTLPTNACGTPAAWQGDDGQGRMSQAQSRAPAPAPVPAPAHASGMPAPSPGAGSNNGSTTTHGDEKHGDEKDPFLSLLEQLAENEQWSNTGGSAELDFFLTGGAHP